MKAAFALVIGFCLLVMAGVLPSLFGELGYTLLMGLTFVALLRLSRKAGGLRWQRGLYALSGAALVTTVANLAWVYGSLAGQLPVFLEFLGAVVWTLEAVPWAYALSVAIFIVYRRLRGAIFIELIAQLAGLVAAVVFIVALTLGFVLSFELGIAVADNVTTFFSAALMLPAAALWFSKAEGRLTRPFLLLSFATFAWFLADILYTRLPEFYNPDMVYNVLSSVQWLLVYVAGVQYLESGLGESEEPTQAFSVGAAGEHTAV